MKRVVVTGMGGVTALGDHWQEIERNLRAGQSAVERIPEWDRYTDLNTRLGAPVRDFKLPAHYTRKVTRTMGRVAQMATLATERALKDAGLEDDSAIRSGAMGIAYGSCTGTVTENTEPL